MLSTNRSFDKICPNHRNRNYVFTLYEKPKHITKYSLCRLVPNDVFFLSKIIFYSYYES